MCCHWTRHHIGTVNSNLMLRLVRGSIIKSCYFFFRYKFMPREKYTFFFIFYLCIFISKSHKYFDFLNLKLLFLILSTNIFFKSVLLGPIFSINIEKYCIPTVDYNLPFADKLVHLKAETACYFLLRGVVYRHAITEIRYSYW